MRRGLFPLLAHIALLGCGAGAGSRGLSDSGLPDSGLPTGSSVPPMPIISLGVPAFSSSDQNAFTGFDQTPTLPLSREHTAYSK